VIRQTTQTKQPKQVSKANLKSCDKRTYKSNVHKRNHKQKPMLAMHREKNNS